MKEDKLKALLKEMTIKEKIAQMYQITSHIFNTAAKHHVDESVPSTGPVTGPAQQWILDKDILYNIGSVLNSNKAESAFQIQKEYLEHNRLQIPLLFMFDIIHGYRTIFPIPLGLACSWDSDLVEETARIAAREGSASGINVTFAPMSDLVRDPRWGRVMESSGEDPLLNEIISAAYVRGFQGEDLRDQDTLVSCVKHFAAYGAPEGGREYNTVDISEFTLRNFYLSGYQGSIEAGAEMVMSSFNIYDGIPATGNKFLLRQLLREEMGFDGVLISDYNSVSEIAQHGAARDGAEAARKSLEAGLDIEMVSKEYVSHLEKLVEDGSVDEALIDEAVMRILKLKNKLGLFEDPFRYIKAEREQKYHLISQHREEARKAAANSMVLLKNDDILPFDKDIESIALIGPFADSKQIIGFWSAMGKNEEAVSLKEGISNKLGKDVEVHAVQGCGFDGDDQIDLEEVEEAIKKADRLVLALGEHQEMSGEGGSRAYLDLPGRQQQLAEIVVEKASKMGKPTVMVLFNGRPLELKWYDKNLHAILEAWFPGTEGGNAIADILFGDVNPSGKLTMSFPYTVGQVPVYYNSYSTGRPSTSANNRNNRFISKYIDIPNQPLYPFGHGLSYSEFSYSELELSKNEMNSGETIRVSVEIQNIGKYAGDEIVQLYIRDLSASTVRPVLELKDFKKIYLEAGESKRINFEISEEMLTFYNAEGEYLLEAGEFDVFVGSSSTGLPNKRRFFVWLF